MLVITLGDPFGVTIELLAGLLLRSEHTNRWPVVLVGSAWQWRDQTQRLGLPALSFQLISSADEVSGPGLYFVDVGSAADAGPAESLSSAARGGVSVRALNWLREVSHVPRLAVVTGPIDKHAAATAGFRYPGQTEFFADLWGQSAIMILSGPRLRVGLVTNHLALRDVSAAITKDLVVAKTLLLIQSLRQILGIKRPHIGVCGLNPHAGDQGLFGDEEVRVIAPALAEVRRTVGDSAVITGPLPADTAFHRGYNVDFTAVLAMYHDQGLGPLKTVHFDNAVNISGGLPHFRASPDHGPAADLYLQHRASSASMDQALTLAAAYLEQCGSPNT